VTAHDDELNAATRASAAGIGSRKGTWTQWGPRRRRLVVQIVATWFALGAVAAVAIALDDLIVLLVGASAALGAKIWLGTRLDDAEDAEDALGADESTELLPDEEELYDELEEADAKSERWGTALGVMKVLGEDPVAMRYVYPTRELLVVRSVAEAFEWIGIAIVLVSAPDAKIGIAIGFMLMVLGGGSGAGVTRAALGQRLYRSPVDDGMRERWLKVEKRLTTALVALLVAFVVIDGAFI